MKILVLLVLCCFLLGCPKPLIERPEACRKVFQPARIDFELGKTFPIQDLVALEKCGFEYHPDISFYAEIISSREYPVPSLLNELRTSEDDYWTAHLIYLTRKVVESERFQSEVMRDRNLLIAEADNALNKIRHAGEVRERARNERDGIELYFVNKDLAGNPVSTDSFSH